MKKYVLTLTLAVILAGCTGSGKIMVLNTPTERHIAKTYSLVAEKSTVGYNASAKRILEQQIKKGLAKANMVQGNDLIIEYRFIQFDEGSRLVRYLTGGLGNSGEGEMSIEVIFKNRNNRELSIIHVGGKITAGFFGGSFDHAVVQAAKQVVRYTITNFKR